MPHFERAEAVPGVSIGWGSKRDFAGLSPNGPGPGYVCEALPAGGWGWGGDSLFCRHGKKKKNSAASPLAGAGLREASVGKNDYGCLFIVTEMCGASDMRQRRPLAAAEALAAGTWFRKTSGAAPGLFPAELTPTGRRSVSLCALYILYSRGKKGFPTPCAFLTCCLALRFSLSSPGVVHCGVWQK